jgi:hypothetical protein
MKRKLSVIGVVATIHFVLWWTIVGTLKASGFDYLNFNTTSPSTLQRLLACLAGIMYLPMGWLFQHTVFDNWWLAVIASLLVNSIIWSVGLCTLYYAFWHQIRNRKAS